MKTILIEARFSTTFTREALILGSNFVSLIVPVLRRESLWMVLKSSSLPEHSSLSCDDWVVSIGDF